VNFQSFIGFSNQMADSTWTERAETYHCKHEISAYLSFDLFLKFYMTFHDRLCLYYFVIFADFQLIGVAFVIFSDKG